MRRHGEFRRLGGCGAGVLVQDAAEGSFLQILGGEVIVSLQNAVIYREELGSFCNLRARGEGRRYGHEIRRECKAERGVRLQSLELAQGAKESSFDAGVMACETIELGGGASICLRGIGEKGVGCGGVELGFHGADTAEVPGGVEQLFEND